ncbi:unnamed protein product, partial [Ectocarpus sp. 12 AP-2014]
MCVFFVLYIFLVPVVRHSRAAGYCMYSSSTILVFTMGDGVNGFTLDPQIGEFVMTHPNIQVPKRGKVRKVSSLRVRFRQCWDMQRKEPL